MTLPTDPQERKKLQLYTFMFEYFPDAWLEVVRVARLGNEQHNPGEPLHWARNKSTDQMNAAFNHLFDYGSGTRMDTSGSYHLANSIWRQMAQLQLDIEQDKRDKVGPFTPKPPDYLGRNFQTMDSPLLGVLQGYFRPSAKDVLETKPNPEINRAIDRLCELEPPKECSGSSGSECSQPQSGRTLAQGHALSRGLARDPIYDAPAIFDAPDPA